MRLFISYRRVDEDFARKIHGALTNEGLDVWLDVVNIRAGDDWSDSIHRGLVGSDVMLLIVTPESMESSNVADEWKYFHSRSRPIIPVHLRTVEDLHYQLHRLQYVDFSNQDFGMALSKLRDEIKRLKSS